MNPILIPANTPKDVLSLAEKALKFLQPLDRILIMAEEMRSETEEEKRTLTTTRLAFEIYAEMFKKTQKAKLHKSCLEEFKKAVAREARLEWGEETEVLFFKIGTVSISNQKYSTVVLSV